MDRSPSPSIKIQSSNVTYEITPPGGATPAGLALLCPTAASITLITPNFTPTPTKDTMPNELIVTLNSNKVAIAQYLTLTLCVPGLLTLLLSLVGSVDELHFTRTTTPTGGLNTANVVKMTRYRRYMGRVVTEEAVVVEHVGIAEEEHGGGGEKQRKTSLGKR